MIRTNSERDAEVADAAFNAHVQAVANDLTEALLRVRAGEAFDPATLSLGFELIDAADELDQAGAHPDDVEGAALMRDAAVKLAQLKSVLAKRTRRRSPVRVSRLRDPSNRARAKSSREIWAAMSHEQIDAERLRRAELDFMFRQGLTTERTELQRLEDHEAAEAEAARERAERAEQERLGERLSRWGHSRAFRGSRKSRSSSASTTSPRRKRSAGASMLGERA